MSTSTIPSPSDTSLIKTPEVLEHEAHVEIEQAKIASVQSEQEHERACNEMVRLATLIKEAHSILDPICEQNHKAWRTACGQRNVVIEPLEQAKTLLGQKVAAWQLRQKRLAEEAEQRQIDAQRRKAAEEREAEIQHAETSGASPEEVSAMCDQPLEVQPVIRAPQPQARYAVNTVKRYKGTVRNLLALCKHVAAHPEDLNLICANQPAINQMVNARGTLMNIPGIEVVLDIGTATRTTVRSSRGSSC